MLTNLIRRFTRSGSATRLRGKRRPQHANFRPQLEALEERCCLSAVQVSIGTSNFTLDEFNEGGAEIVVTRSGGLADPFFGGGHSVTVKYIVGREPSDTATLGKDYKAERGVLRFGKFETVKTIRVSSINDRIDEFDERFSIRLSQIAVSKGGTGSFGDDLIAVSINDEDSAPLVTIAGPKAITEASKTLNYKVKLSEQSGKIVELDYGVIGLDPTLKFSALGSRGEGDLDVLGREEIGVLTFQPGQTEQTISIRINEDKIVEPDEEFAIGVFAKQNAGGSFELSAKIINDDKAILGIRGLISPTKHLEFEGQSGDTVITLQIRLFSDLEIDVFGAYETFDGTATVDDADYVPSFVGVPFAAGSRGAQSEVFILVNVVIKGDTKKEKTEKFFVTLLEDDLQFKIVGGTVTVFITDDDNE